MIIAYIQVHEMDLIYLRSNQKLSAWKYITFLFFFIFLHASKTHYSFMPDNLSSM